MQPSKPKKRLFRFGLRTIFVITTLFAILAVLFMSWWVPYQRQLRAVEICRSTNSGYATLIYEPMEEMPSWKKSVAKKLGKDAVAKIESATFHGNTISLNFVADLRNLEAVNFFGLENVSLEPLKDHPGLEVFYASESSFTEDDLVTIAELANLKKLNIGTEVPEAPFAKFCQSNSLQAFHLNAREIKNLDPLKNLKQLELLEIFVPVHNGKLVDYQPIGELTNLKVLSLHFSYLAPDVDFTDLKQLPNLKLLIIEDELSDEIQQNIEDWAPNGCQIEVGNYGDLDGDFEPPYPLDVSTTPVLNRLPRFPDK